MQQVLMGLDPDSGPSFVSAYIDDILIFSVRKYLEHILTPDGLKPNPTLLPAVQEFPVPTTVQELMRFLGLASNYR